MREEGPAVQVAAMAAAAARPPAPWRWPAGRPERHPASWASSPCRIAKAEGRENGGERSPEGATQWPAGQCPQRPVAACRAPHLVLHLLATRPSAPPGRVEVQESTSHTLRHEALAAGAA